MVNYFEDGVTSNTDDVLLNGVPIIKKVSIMLFYINCSDTSMLYLYRERRWKGSSSLWCVIQDGKTKELEFSY